MSVPHVPLTHWANNSYLNCICPLIKLIKLALLVLDLNILLFKISESYRLKRISLSKLNQQGVLFAILITFHHCLPLRKYVNNRKGGGVKRWWEKMWVMDHLDDLISIWSCTCWLCNGRETAGGPTPKDRVWVCLLQTIRF